MSKQDDGYSPQPKQLKKCNFCEKQFYDWKAKSKHIRKYHESKRKRY